MAEERKNAHVKTRASKTGHCPRPWPAWAGHCQLWPFMAAYGNVNPPSQNYSEKADSRYHLSPVTGPCYFHWATSSRYARGNGHGRCFCCCCFFCRAQTWRGMVAHGQHLSASFGHGLPVASHCQPGPDMAGHGGSWPAFVGQFRPWPASGWPFPTMPRHGGAWWFMASLRRPVSAMACLWQAIPNHGPPWRGMVVHGQPLSSFVHGRPLSAFV